MSKWENCEEASIPLNLDIKSEIDVQVEPLDSCIKYTLEDDENYDSVRNKNQISEHVENSNALNPHCIYVKTEDEVAEEEMDVCDDGDLKIENVCDRELKISDFEKKFEEMKDGFSNDEEKGLDISSSLLFNFSILKNTNNGFEAEGNEVTDVNRMEASCSQQEGQLEKRFRCSLCKYQTNRKDHFNGHLLIHSAAKLLKCPECDYECNQKGNLKVHILTHSSIKLFKCFECNYECNEKGNLKKHLLTHSDTKLFKCTECDYKCKRKSNLKNHLLTHSSEKLFKCLELECNYECNLKSNLKNHLLTHSSNKVFKCFECNYECNLKSNLQIHLLTHSNKKLFKCSKCDYECNVKSNLKVHVLTHSNTKLFKCPECDYECNWKGNLKRHSLTHSNPMPF